MTRLACIVSMVAVGALLTACSPKFDWREIRSPDGGFVVNLPDKPQTVSRDVDFDGGKVTMTMTSTGVGPTMFAAGFARLPAGALVDAAAIERTVAFFRDGLVRNIEGTLTRTQAVALSPAAAAGRAVRAGEAIEARGRIGRDARAARLAARFYVADDRIYQVVAMGAEGELTADTLETFFSSFRLMPQGPK